MRSSAAFWLLAPSTPDFLAPQGTLIRAKSRTSIVTRQNENSVLVTRGRGRPAAIEGGRSQAQCTPF